MNLSTSAAVAESESGHKKHEEAQKGNQLRKASQIAMRICFSCFFVFFVAILLCG